MTRDELEAIFTKGGDWLTPFYMTALYRMGEKPWLFWAVAILAGLGAVRVAQWLF